MCISGPKAPEPTKPKEPTIIRNLYLDGVNPATKAQRSGRSGLRIERGVAPVGANPLPAATPAVSTATGSALSQLKTGADWGAFGISRLIKASNNGGNGKFAQAGPASSPKWQRAVELSKY